jgi:hypothetical protein
MVVGGMLIGVGIPLLFLNLQIEPTSRRGASMSIG